MLDGNTLFEAAKFVFIFFIIIGTPCVLVAFMGKNMIDKLGQYPTKTPAIQMSVFFKLVTIEILTFGALIVFHNFYTR